MDTTLQDTLFFFDRHQAVYPLYACFQEKLLAGFPESRIKVQKSQISYYNRHLYACVSFLKLKKKSELPDDYFVLTLGLPAPLESDRVAAKTEPYSGMRLTNRKLVKIKMIINVDYDLKGSILDIGGGGEAIIGKMYGDRVTAIDNRQEELDEAPNCCTKLLMDAEKLSFFDGLFDNATFFYTLMYMSEETQRKAIFEAARVLKTGGIMCIWDCTISPAYPEPFVVDLDIQFTDKRIHTSYGIVKLDPQSSDSISQLLKSAGLNIVSMKEESGQFHITCRKD